MASSLRNWKKYLGEAPMRADSCITCCERLLDYCRACSLVTYLKEYLLIVYRATLLIS